MRICSINGCIEKHVARGYCAKHYREARQTGKFKTKICSVKGCGNNHYVKGLCEGHHARLRKGQPILNTPLIKKKQKNINIKTQSEFLSSVEMIPECGCWIWMGVSGPRGYGYLRFQGKPWRAHRLSFKLFNGPIPNGLFVCHHCDTPSCVNPHHLFLGTNKDNILDASMKGRLNPVRGESNKNAKLTSAMVIEIKKSKDSCRAIAKKYGIHNTTAALIKNGTYWKHIVV